MTNGKRIEYLDIVKGLAILLVIIGHEIDYSAECYGDILPNAWVIAKAWISYTHIPAFFLASGVFADKLARNSLGKNICNIFGRLMIPYFIWVTLLTLVNLIFAPILGTEADWNRLLRSVYEPFGQFWFLYALFLVEIVYAIVIVVGSNARLRHLLVLVIFTVLFITRELGVDYPLLISNVAQFGIYYAVGICISFYLLSGENRQQLTFAVAFIIAIILYWLFLFAGLDMAVTLAANAVGISGLLALSLVIDRHSKRIKQYLLFCGNNSLEFYNIHPYINMVIRIIAGMMITAISLRTTISFMLVIIITSLVVWIIPKNWLIVKIAFGRIKLVK